MWSKKGKINQYDTQSTTKPYGNRASRRNAEPTVEFKNETSSSFNNSERSFEQADEGLRIPYISEALDLYFKAFEEIRKLETTILPN